MSEPTLYAWKKQFQAKGAVVPSHATGPHGWDAKAKLAALMQTALMNEAERSAYCRENGLYVEQLETWKAAFESMGQASDGNELSQSRKTNRELQKELQRKEKALAETAALLVLSKKPGPSGAQTRCFDARAHETDGHHPDRAIRAGGCAHAQSLRSSVHQRAHPAPLACSGLCTG